MRPMMPATHARRPAVRVLLFLLLAALLLLPRGAAAQAVTHNVSGRVTLQGVASGNLAQPLTFTLVPAGDVPPPGWATDVIPTDDGSEAGGAGPGSSLGVVLPSGVEENTPGPDLGAYNPVGPSVTYERLYRSSLAASGYGSPGLSPGWVDDYDLRVTPGSGSYTLHYPNGAADAWSVSGSVISPPPGAPYLASAPAPGVLTMTFKDRSVYTFTQIPAASANYLQNTYLLTGITNLVGRSVALNRDPANNYRLQSITNDAGAMLLKFNYSGANLSSVEDLASPNSGEHRQVNYTFSGGSLKTVSQVAADGGSAPDLWRYVYQATGGQYLNSVATPDPQNPGSAYTSATIAYDPTGFVLSHTDANGRLRAFGYGPTGVQLQVFNQYTDPSPVQRWTQSFGPNNVDTGFVDAAGHAASVSYANTPSPYLPAAVTNRNNQTASITYGPANSYDNVTSATDPRGVQVNTTYSYPADFALGQPASVQTVSGSSSLAPTSFTYYGPGDGAINGLVKTVTSPLPGTVGGTATVTTTYTYDSLGNVTQMTTPGPNGMTTVTYNYTSGYNGYTQTEALGEPVAVTVSGPANGGGTTATVTYSEYDGRGNRKAVIDCLNNETDFYFNLADQPISTVNPATNQTGGGRSHVDTVYQYVGGPVSTTSLYDEGSQGLVRQTGYTYGHEGELLQTSDLLGPVMAYRYDGRYRVVGVQDGQNLQNGHGNSTFYQFDSVGNLSQVLYPRSNGGSTGPGAFDTLTYTYDADQNLLFRTDGNGATTAYTRDTSIDSRLNGITYPAGSNTPNVTLGYDAFERLTNLNSLNTVAKTYAYDDVDDMLSAAVSFTGGPQSQTLTYSYNPDGSRSQMAFSLPIGSTGQKIYTYQYDGLGQLTRAGFPWTGGSLNHTYVTNATTGYVRAGWLQTSQTPAFKTAYTYNPLGQITTLLNTSTFDNSTTSQFNLAYDAAGNKVSSSALIPVQNAAPAASRTQAWAYDARDELLEDRSAPTGSNAYNESYDHFFNYDLSENTLAFRASAPNTVANTFNIDNQIGNMGFSFDGNGNPTSYASSTPLSGPSFDIENRLVGLSSPAFSASYAPDDRRASKTAAGATTYYVYDEAGGGPTPLVGERVSGGGPAAYEAFGVGADGVRARYEGAGVGQYDVFQWDPSGSYVQSTRQQTYPTFGTRVADTGPFEAWGRPLPDTLASTGGPANRLNPTGFQGQAGAYTDLETGLVLMGHRYYDPGTGRFLTRDPIGYGGGANLYGFTGNNPVNEQDSGGLSPGGDEAASYLGNLFDHSTFSGLMDSLKNDVTGNYNLRLAGHAGRQVWDILWHINDAENRFAMSTMPHNVQMTSTSGVHGPLIFTMKGILRSQAGFSSRGSLYILDTSVEVSSKRPLPGQAIADRLRAQGYNVRSVREVFGRDPGDPAIRQFAQQVGAKVIAVDRGRDIGGGFGELAPRGVSQGLRRLNLGSADEVFEFLVKVLPK